MVLQLSDDEVAGLLTVGEDELIGDRLMEEFNDQQQQVTVAILSTLVTMCVDSLREPLREYPTSS